MGADTGAPDNDRHGPADPGFVSEDGMSLPHGARVAAVSVGAVIDPGE